MKTTTVFFELKSLVSCELLLMCWSMLTYERREDEGDLAAC